MSKINRRQFVSFMGIGVSAGVSSLLAVPFSAWAQKTNTVSTGLLEKNIPSSQEPLAVIGMGTWQTFNVGSDPRLREQRSAIVDLFFKMGGQLIDSSPMYGSSQQVIGYALEQLNYPQALLSAEKVWTHVGSDTRKQIEKTTKAWGLERFDLMQIHNLLSWEEHIEVLMDMKRKGELRYIGITTSHGRRHKELESIMADYPVDFVQLTYNLEDREAEKRLLPLAQERNIAVIANRPFQGGNLIGRLQRSNASLPEFAKEIDCHNWPQFLLKFIVSHPAVTCAIPATTQLHHLQENMGAARGRLPNAEEREKMLAYVRSL